MLELLVVRPYRYHDERQVLIEEIGAMWDTIPRPPQVMVSHCVLPRKVAHFAGCERLYPFIARSWFALREWARTPARWICIADADIIPIRRDALNILLNELRALPPNINMVSASYLTWLHKWVDYWRTGLSSEGLSTGAPDGLHTIRYDILPHIARMYNFYSGYFLHRQPYGIFPPEPSYSCIVPRAVNNGVFSQQLVQVISTWDASVDLNQLQHTCAFVHPVGDIRLIARIISHAWLLLGG